MHAEDFQAVWGLLTQMCQPYGFVLDGLEETGGVGELRLEIYEADFEPHIARHAIVIPSADIIPVPLAMELLDQVFDDLANCEGHWIPNEIVLAPYADAAA